MTGCPNMKKQNKRYLEWGICFWIGIGLMGIINIWKIKKTLGIRKRIARLY